LRGARIDLDYPGDEALIKEELSDWITGVQWASKYGWRIGEQRVEAWVLQHYAQEPLGWLQ